MLELYFKYPGVLRRLRSGVLGGEMDRIAAHFAEIGYKRASRVRNGCSSPSRSARSRWPNSRTIYASVISRGFRVPDILGEERIRPQMTSHVRNICWTVTLRAKARSRCAPTCCAGREPRGY